MTVPAEETRGWSQYIGPVGFQERLGVAPFTTDGRHVGMLTLNTEDLSHPSDLARDRISVLAPLIVNAIDPLRSIVTAAALAQRARQRSY